MSARPTPAARQLEAWARRLRQPEKGSGRRARTAGYLLGLPKAIPSGMVLVHSHVRPTRVLGRRGFRAWLATGTKGLASCNCGWAAGLGKHYRVAEPRA